MCARECQGGRCRPIASFPWAFPTQATLSSPAIQFEGRGTSSRRASADGPDWRRATASASASRTMSIRDEDEVSSDERGGDA